MLKWEHILILGFRELGSVFVHAPRLFRDTKKHDLTLTTSTYKQNSVPWSQLGLCLHIAFCAYGLWANLAWESPYSEVFPWVRKPVNVTWSEILQKHKQDLSWNTLNSTEFRHVNCPELHPTRDLCLGVFHVFQKHKENLTADAANAELTCLLSDNPKLCKCTLSLLEPTAKHLIKVTLVNEEKCTYPFSQEHGLRVPNKTPKLLEL